MNTKPEKKTGPGMETEPGKMYEYYQDLELLPTFGDLQNEADLEKFGEIRVDLFANKIMMPLSMFEGTSMLHVGPDSGEHSLVFAQWGADLTLVEPNPFATRQINTYFERFGMEEKLKAIHETDIEGFSKQPVEQLFDMVDAEGFIYTLQPASDWLRVFHNSLKTDGLMIVSYYARLGGFFELSLRALHRAVRDITGKDAEEAAWMLFEAKWDSIPHNKPFKFWVLDMLENPYVRARYFMDPAELCREAEEHGFSLYSSWPNLRDPLEVYWHKSPTIIHEQMASPGSHLARSCLSHFTGRKMYLTTSDPEVIAKVIEILDGLVEQMDILIDGLDDAVLSRCSKLLHELGAMIPSLEMMTEHPDTKSEVISLLAKLEEVIGWIGNGNVDDLTSLTNNDIDFIHTWGLPTHVAVFRKVED